MPNIEGPVLSISLDASAAERGAKAFADAIDKIISAGKRAALTVDDLGGEARNLSPSFDQAGGSTKRLKRDLDEVGTSAKNVKSDFSGLAGNLVAGFAGGIAAGVIQQLKSVIIDLPRSIIEVSDAYSRLDSRIVQSTKGMEGAVNAHHDLVEASTRTHTSLQSTGEFFARVAAQSRELGLSYRDLVSLTENLQMAFKLGGQSASETAAVMTQLSQAFAKGRLDGDEFRSVMEGAPQLIQLMAESLGATKEQLFEFAEQGRLTTDVIAKIVNNAGPELRAAFDQMTVTVSDATTDMGTAWNELLAQFNKTGGVTSGVVDLLQQLTQLLRDEGPAAAAALGAAFVELTRNIAALIEAGKPVAAFLNSLVDTATRAGVAVNKAFGGTGGEAGARFRGATGSWEEPISNLQEALPPSLQGPQQRWGELQVKSEIVLPPPRAKAGRAAGSGREQKLDLDFGKPFEAEITALNQRMEGSLTRTQENAKKLLTSITEAYASSFGDQVKIIEMKRDKDIEAINLAALNAEEKARGRTMVEEGASRQILQVRQRELDQSLGYMEQLEQAYNKQFRLDSSGNRGREIQQSQQLRQLDTQRGLSGQQRSTARAQIMDMTRPLTELERAGESMVEFGEKLTGIDAMVQGVVQGISQVGSTTASIFADAIMGGEDFMDTLSKLGESLTKMLIQMTMQLAMQQAIGAAVGGIGGMFAPQPTAGAGTSGNQAAMAGLGGGLFAGGGTGFFSKGGVVQSTLPQGVYIHPTYFERLPVRRYAKGDIIETGLHYEVYSKPTYFPLNIPGKHEFAKGMGVLGEAGPEAVLPLQRTPSGELGVRSQGNTPDVNVNVVVNNQSSAHVRTESRGDAQGNKDILITIADQVEQIVASRISRNGTMSNRAVSSVGGVNSR